uniref:Uncharacterized protein n=1 Tax=Helicotheca tamesis TaxID=374047 RepID=A0A7S2HJI2_9STRA|mmetsp:Transcript_18541/g.25509  ORF Transcript_18541/g.25509 Transcript_18541/m.25509 type:complete len:256 (+) Transcript_18541:54-821(+)
MKSSDHQGRIQRRRVSVEYLLRSLKHDEIGSSLILSDVGSREIVFADEEDASVTSSFSSCERQFSKSLSNNSPNFNNVERRRSTVRSHTNEEEPKGIDIDPPKRNTNFKRCSNKVSPKRRSDSFRRRKSVECLIDSLKRDKVGSSLLLSSEEPSEIIFSGEYKAEIIFKHHGSRRSSLHMTEKKKKNTSTSSAKMETSSISSDTSCSQRRVQRRMAAAAPSKYKSESSIDPSESTGRRFCRRNGIVSPPFITNYE